MIFTVSHNNSKQFTRTYVATLGILVSLVYHNASLG